MEKLNKESEDIMIERFGTDSIIALATLEGNMPHEMGKWRREK